jgi:hypothetical protein
MGFVFILYKSWVMIFCLFKVGLNFLIKACLFYIVLNL